MLNPHHKRVMIDTACQIHIPIAQIIEYNRDGQLCSDVKLVKYTCINTKHDFMNIAYLYMYKELSIY